VFLNYPITRTEIKMTIQEIQEYSLTKTGAYEDHPFGPEPTVIKVATKIFAIIGVDSISLKCEPFTADHLRQMYLAVKPGYHLNKQHWNSISIDGTVPNDELKWMVDHSYELVSKSLNKVLKKQINSSDI